MLLHALLPALVLLLGALIIAGAFIWTPNTAVEMNRRIGMVARTPIVQPDAITGSAEKRDGPLFDRRIRQLYSLGTTCRWGMQSSGAKVLLISAASGVSAMLFTQRAVSLPLWIAITVGFIVAWFLPRILLLRQQEKAENKFLDLFPDAIDTLYNIACLHCLLGHEEEAYTWLERAVEAGYDDADHLLKDDDFKAIREQDRFKQLVERVRERSGDDEEPVVDEGLVASILGEWEMKTKLEEQFIEATMSLSIQDHRLAGVWLSQGREMVMRELRFDGSKLSFKRNIGPGQELEFHGTVEGDRISGTYTGAFGELECSGRRKSTP